MKSILCLVANFVKVCHRNLDINECVKENMNNAKKYMPKGLPKLFVPPTNPFKIEKIEIASPTLKIELRNFNVAGLHDFDVKNVDIDLENNKFGAELMFKYIAGYGKYQLSGSLLLINVNGAGECFGNHTDLGIALKMGGDRYERNGKEFIDFTNREIKLRLIGDAYMHFKNIFPFDDLTWATNRILNRNVKAATKELQPVLEETIVAVLSQSIQKLFDTYSIDELFPL